MPHLPREKIQQKDSSAVKGRSHGAGVEGYDHEGSTGRENKRKGVTAAGGPRIDVLIGAYRNLGFKVDLLQEQVQEQEKS
ncbi:MAG: hypothetical protein ACLR23_05570 [Clostridia bacterium]